MTFLALCFAVGALHVVMPDHWIPYSLESWQRRRSSGQTLLGSVPFVGAHLFLGWLLFVVIQPFLSSSSSNFVFAVVFVLASVFLRSLRHSRVAESQRAGPQSTWGGFASLSLLGPAESLVPILIQCRNWGISALAPFAAYALGTALVFGTLSLLGRWVWNRPVWMVRGLSWTQASGVFRTPLRIR